MGTNTETARELVWVYFDSGARGWCVQLIERGDAELVSCHYTRAQAEGAARRFAQSRGARVVVWAVST